MYYYYAVTQTQIKNGIKYRDHFGKYDNRVNLIKFLRVMEDAMILNLIELTEEEYNELKRDQEGNIDD